jgi:hypothetical protein
MSNPYEGFQDFVGQMPELLQPLLIAVAGAVPYIEGEGSAALGVIAGLNPIVAGIAGASGNILCVILVVLLSSRIREGALSRKARRTAEASALSGGGSASGGSSTFGGSSALSGSSTFGGSTPGAQTSGASTSTQLYTTDEQTRQLPADADAAADSKKSKGRARLRRWIVKFGVPGASLIAPLALPTQLTAATLVASGVNKGWVILWQIVAIVMWTGAVTLVATGVLSVITG